MPKPTSSAELHALEHKFINKVDKLPKAKQQELLLVLSETLTAYRRNVAQWRQPLLAKLTTIIHTGTLYDTLYHCYYNNDYSLIVILRNHLEKQLPPPGNTNVISQ